MLPVSAISVIKAMTFGKQVSLFKVISYMIFYQSAWAATAKCHSLCGLNNGHAFPHSSGDWTSTVTVPAPLVSGETARPGPRTAAFSVSSRGLYLPGGEETALWCLSLFVSERQSQWTRARPGDLGSY